MSKMSRYVATRVCRNMNRQDRYNRSQTKNTQQDTTNNDISYAGLINTIVLSIIIIAALCFVAWIFNNFGGLIGLTILGFIALVIFSFKR